MNKKLLRKRKPIRILKQSHSRKALKRGKVGFGVMVVLAVVGVLSFGLVFGLQRLSPYGTQTMTGYLCCDSGDGEACTPNIDVPLRVRINGIEAEYHLLKTGIKLAEGSGHLAPILPVTEYITEVPAGQYVYVNSVSEDSSLQEKYVKPGGKCRIHGARLDPMDTIFAKNLPEGCEAIPNDEIVYLCTKGCENDPIKGENGVFNAYFRYNDLAAPGIPETVKNCEKPIGADTKSGSQRIINLPSPSGQPDLQLETFYIENDNVVANWVSPYCKPAVYLYPTEKTSVQVRVNPLGQTLVTTPAYTSDGWRVTAYPNGDIYHNNTRFDYLFYEASIPDESIELPAEGFVVAYETFEVFLPDLVQKLGLNVKETRQFSEYWLKVLPQSPYYQIKIVKQATLGRISPLYIIPVPKTSIRVTLHFTPLEKYLDLPEPLIASPVRNGFTVVEWGGIFKRDAKHPFSCLM